MLEGRDVVWGIVDRLGLCIATARSVGSIPGQGPNIPHAAWCGQKEKRNARDRSPCRVELTF